MLNFYSASVRSANTERAVEECLDILSKDNTNLPEDCNIIIVNATMGHSLEKIASLIKQRFPETLVLGASCCGVTGKEGVGESMNEIAMIGICGEQGECAAHSVNGIYASNSYEKGLELAENLKKKTDNPAAIYLICPSLDIVPGLVIEAFDKVFKDVVIGGGTTSDNMRGIVNYQYIGNQLTEHGAWAVAFAEKDLNAISRATHGFVAAGDPMTVTKADEYKIIEIDGKPAWKEYIAKAGVKGNSLAEILAMGALAEELPEDLAKEYANSHILRGIVDIPKDDNESIINYPAAVKEGLKLYLTERNEEFIFSEHEKYLERIKKDIEGKEIVAVFHSDCLVRGRLLFNKIKKDEMLVMMQNILSNKGSVPPWIGIFGFGEYARLGDKNAYHNFSAALLILYR